MLQLVALHSVAILGSWTDGLGRRVTASYLPGRAMSSAAKTEALMVLHRFGMGPRPGSITAIESDPRGALIAELERPFAGEIAADELPSSAKAYRAVTDAYAKRQAKARVAKKEQDAKRQMMAEVAPMTEETAPGMEMANKVAAEAVPDPGRSIYLDEARLRIAAALSAEIGFAERLVWFWSNHFCISCQQDQEHVRRLRTRGDPPSRAWPIHRSVAGCRRPSSHAFYLDQTVSMGANSIAGINNTRGLNENWPARFWNCIRWACGPATPRTTSSPLPKC